MVSYTRLSMYERCPASTGFRYRDKLYGPSSPAASRGKKIHQSIENFLTEKAITVHKEVRQWMKTFKRILKKDPFVEEKLAVDNKWRDSTWDGGKARIIGVVDAGHLYGNKIRLHEWKTGKKYDNHADQRDMYACLAMARWPASQEVRVKSYYLDLNETEYKDYTEEDLVPIRKEFKTRIRFMANDDILAARPGWYCKWCPYSRFVKGPCRSG